MTSGVLRHLVRSIDDVEGLNRRQWSTGVCVSCYDWIKFLSLTLSTNLEFCQLRKNTSVNVRTTDLIERHGCDSKENHIKLHNRPACSSWAVLFLVGHLAHREHRSPEQHSIRQLKGFCGSQSWSSIGASSIKVRVAKTARGSSS